MKPSTTCIKPGSRVLGADVAKAAVVLFDPVSGRTWSVANSPAALREALVPFADYDLLVCETTGGHELALLGAALDLDLPAHRADAARVKSYIRSHGGAAKTDPIDARWLTLYGQDRGEGLARWTPVAPDIDALASLVRHRQDLVRAQTEAKNRSSAPGAELLRSFLDAQIAFLKGQIRELDQAIAERVARNAELAQREARLREVKGIGPIVARTLLAFIPELGQLNRKEVASLAGLAPHPRDSGQTFQRRRTGAGRDGLKPILFLAALSASRTHPDLKLFAQRLEQAGKPKRLILVAVARKLVVIANAVCKTLEPQLT
jgi:transposase